MDAVVGQSLIRRWGARIGTWRTVAAMVTAALVVYYAFLGAQYYTDSRQINALSYQIADMERTLKQPLPNDQELATALSEEEGNLQALVAPLQNSETDEITRVLSETARESGVGLGSVLMGEPFEKAEGEIVYRSQPVTIKLDGSNEEVQGFLSLLGEKAPMVALASLRMSGLEGTPSVQAQFVLSYLAPTPLAEGS